MASDNPLWYESGDLGICPELGEIRNSRGMSARLGLVNMKVLALLVRRHGQVVTRNELFETVWKNQLVGDDTLTRCISDIRAQIGRLSSHDGCIETLPKRGYRWTLDARETSLPSHLPAEQPLGHVRPGTAAVPAPVRRRPSLGWIGRWLAYGAALLVIASVGAWLMGQFARPGPPVVAVLPIPAQPLQLDLAAAVEKELTEYLLRLDQVDVLSRSAIDSRPTNPFPYFYYEFGARWLVESELQNLAGQIVLTVALVDARTGIVLAQSTEPIALDEPRTAASIDKAFQPLKQVIEAELRRRAATVF